MKITLTPTRAAAYAVILPVIGWLACWAVDDYRMPARMDKVEAKLERIDRNVEKIAIIDGIDLQGSKNVDFRKQEPVRLADKIGHHDQN